jgi:hypothetical protein
MRYRESAQAISVPVTGSQRVEGGDAIIMGWGLLETTGAAAAVVEIYDGFDATAQLVVAVALTAGQSTRDWLGPNGILVTEGIFVNVISGTVRGTVWARLRRPGT